jgi:hypothetical protein
MVTQCVFCEIWSDYSGLYKMNSVLRSKIKPNPFSRTIALVSTQPLTEVSTRNLSTGTGRPARKSDNLTAIYEPIF